MQDAEFGMPSFAVKVELAVLLLVEVYAPAYEFLDLVRCASYDHLHCFPVVDPVAGNHCIFNMFVEIVYQQVGYRSNASLREIGVRFFQLCLADDGYFPFIGYLQSEAHAGDTGTDH